MPIDVIGTHVRDDTHVRASLLREGWFTGCVDFPTITNYAL